MLSPNLLSRLRDCLRYKEAGPIAKPFIDPSRFIRNQLRKYGVLSGKTGTLNTVETFHLSEFTVVHGEVVSQDLACYGMFEPALTEAFIRLVKPGQTVVDIGMHLGYYATLFALLVGEQGRVHAFEPTPSTRDIAQKNTARFPQVRVHPFAVWSSSQTIPFHDFGPRWMAFNSLTEFRMEQAPVEAKTIQVQTTTLDSFHQAEKTGVALIKIDAESAEREILAGAKNLIAADHPIISVEVGDHGESNSSRLLVGDLIALDYQPWEFVHGAFERHSIRDRYDYDNLIFAPTAMELSTR
ncbi:MAG: FkbM family methyltransferase [Verrucomicrobia bacterium]|nr:FkbM family methyltransferase [Verrucomicrobiota bacterium]